MIKKTGRNSEVSSNEKIEHSKELHRIRCRRFYYNHLEKERERSRNKQRKYYKANREKCIAYAKENRMKNPEKVKGNKKRYYAKHSGFKTKLNQNYRKKYPEKYKASNIFTYALNSGKLVRPTICSICKKNCIPEGHHENYEQPLIVIWVCDKCHRNIHQGKLG